MRMYINWIKFKLYFNLNTLGGVKPDGNTIIINSRSGVISSSCLEINDAIAPMPFISVLSKYTFFWINNSSFIYISFDIFIQATKIKF